MTDPIRNDVKYIAELFQEGQWSPRLAIADGVYSREDNIYAFSIASLITEETDPTNYWILWGGTFDNPTGFGLQVYMNQFLTEVFLSANLLSTDNSFYIDQINNICYINIPRKPWQYFQAYTSVYGNFLSTFSTAPKNANNPSDIMYGGVRTEPRMDTPRLENGLSEVLSGVNMYNTFEITVANNDGKYDGLDITSYFNTPLQVSKSNAKITDSIEDFNTVRKGIVSNIDVDFEKMVIEATDQLYTLTTDYNPKYTKAEFESIADGTVNKDINVGWGIIKGVEPEEVNKDTSDPATWIDYIALDKDYITSVQGVYDEDGTSLTHSLNTTTGIIRVTSVDGDGKVIEAEYMNVTGKTDCSIMEGITFALDENENIAYTEGIWDVTETDAYDVICPDVGVLFEGGTTRELVIKFLKNDLAFLIQKNDGRLSLRRWGEEYDTHYISNEWTTQEPSKNFEVAKKYYCNSCKVQYDRFQKEDSWQMSYLEDTDSKTIFEQYRLEYLAEFETELTTEADAKDLAERIMERFGEVRETLKVGMGVDTFEINPLDTVVFEANINGRAFSEFSRWIVKQCDPGQDTLEMEGTEIDYPLTFDGVPATLDGEQWVVSGEIN